MLAYKGTEFLRYWGKHLTRKKYLHSGNLRTYQIKSINEMVSNARAHSPFYMELYEEYSVPKDFVVRTLADIRKLPVVKKEAFKAACSENQVLCANLDEKNLHRERTTGSTGVPTEIFFTRDSQQKKKRVKNRVFHDAGVRRYDRYCMIWRSKPMSPRDIARQRNKLYFFLAAGDISNPMQSTLTREKINRSVRLILDFNPQIMHGYVSALFTIAEYLEKNNLDLPELKRVVTAAEYLPPTVWTTLENIFKCPVINFYGASEASAIACSGANTRNMTISEDLYFAEVLDENDQPVRPGKPGLITLTNLTAKAMPFIRFQIGDMAMVDDDFYNYGEDFRYFNSVEGRTNDVFELADGAVIFSHLWHIFFRDQLWIERFQVIQRSPSSIEIKILPLRKNESEFRSFRKLIQEKFEGISFDFRIVNGMEFGPGDKFRAVISYIPNRFNRVNK